MSDNAAVIRRMFDEIINQGKLDVVDELFDPEFRTETPQGELDRDGFREYVRGWRAGFSDVHCEVDDIIEDGDRIAWSIRATGTHDGEFMGIPPTGRTIDFDSLNIATFRDGRGYRHKVVMDTAKMLMQLGVVPEPA
jgi:predicted ester cyclase